MAASVERLREKCPGEVPPRIGARDLSQSAGIHRWLYLHRPGKDGPPRLCPTVTFADTLVAMICEWRWVAIGLVLSLSGLACSRTPMDTPGTGGGASTGGTTDTIAAGATTASGGRSGTGGANGKGGTWGGTAPSCRGLAATCGPSRTDDCCKSLLVPGGTFYRSYDGVDFTDKSYPATVSDFYLDKYEITVGRFRVFVTAGMGTQARPPTAGAGANPAIAGSGWDSTWNTNLAATRAALTSNLKCQAPYYTWTDTAGSNEDKPVNCLDWYTAFSFCAWDGGRLPTDAEWNYAASGGSEQRYYPWSNPSTSAAIDASYAVYFGDSCLPLAVGLKSPKGDGKWGQSDLAGNVWKWTLDWDASYTNPCNNCADLTAGSYRVIRGGNFCGLAAGLRSAYRSDGFPGYPSVYVGARCARSSL